TIKNFTINAPTNKFAIRTDAPASSGETFENNIINVSGSATGVIEYSTSDTTITGSAVDFADGGNWGIKKNRALVSNVTVSDNTFTGNATGVDALINFIPDGTGHPPCPVDDGIDVTGNHSTAT